jgi:ubiquinone/menaquinone biosynthesis C-methylase UbiE
MFKAKSKKLIDDKKLIKFNENVHNKIYGSYDIKHKEGIFSLIEQQRLQNSLQKAINFLDKSIKIYKGLDLGCGTGNLTNHLLKLGINVTAADISNKFLDIVNSKYGKNNSLIILKINGSDLSNISDNSFDIIALYAVLHHVPDYIKIVKELIRVCKLGGIIYIDHEVNDFYWNPNNYYLDLIKKANNKIEGKKWKKYFKLSNYYNKLTELFKKVFFKSYPRNDPLSPRYQPDGDIHVWKDDHIEWNKIILELKNANFEIVVNENFLLYKEKYGMDLYNEYKNKCSDYKVLVAKKKKIY